MNAYEKRRSRGWGVDPVRCRKYLTSSQTLTFNMFSEVIIDAKNTAELFNLLLDRRDLSRLESAEFEFSAAATPYWIGDRTLLDLLLRFRTTNGQSQVVAVETKLADRFSTRRTEVMSRRGGDQGRDRSIWSDLHGSLEHNRTRQMTRCHLLADAVQQVDNGAASRLAVFIVLLHPEDLAGLRATDLYASGLNAKVAHAVSWDDFLELAGESGSHSPALVERLSLRYVDMRASEWAWANIEGLRSRPKPPSEPERSAAI